MMQTDHPEMIELRSKAVIPKRLIQAWVEVLEQGRMIQKFPGDLTGETAKTVFVKYVWGDEFIPCSPDEIFREAELRLGVSLDVLNESYRMNFNQTAFLLRCVFLKAFRYNRGITRTAFLKFLEAYGVK